jgi:hypothetical protein
MNPLTCKSKLVDSAKFSGVSVLRNSLKWGWRSSRLNEDAPEQWMLGLNAVLEPMNGLFYLHSREVVVEFYISASTAS